MAVANDLHLNVTRIVDILLNQHAVVAERGRRLALGADDRRCKLLCRPHDPHATAAAAGGCLHQNRETDPRRFLRKRRLVLRLAVIARHQRHAGLLHQSLRARLRAHRFDHLGGRSDEDDAGLRATVRKLLALGQEAVARMDRLGPRLLGRLQDAIDVQVAVLGTRGSKQDGGVRHLDMQRASVGL